MDPLTLAAIGLAALLALGIVVVMLRRSWGGSLSNLPQASSIAPPLASTREIADSDLAEVSALLARGNKIEAIKRVRELTGLGLKEAKDYVEGLPLVALQALPAPAVHYASIADVPESDLAEIFALLARGNKIEAIKRVRELTGLGLKEAKDYVEAMPADGPPPALPNTTAVWRPGEVNLAEVHTLALQGRKIAAIKRYRELTGVGLKEAKDYVDGL